jgi:prefoldin subunit 5
LSAFCCSSPLYARESYTITVAQVEALTKSLTTLKNLTISLCQKLESYKQGLQVTAQELAASQQELKLVKSESNTFILKLNNQQKTLLMQSESLTSAKKSLKRLRRRNRAKDILFTLIIGGLIAIRR